MGYGYRNRRCICCGGNREVVDMIDLYALAARKQTARYLNKRQRVWMKVVGMAFASGFLLGVGAVIWVIATGVPGSR